MAPMTEPMNAPTRLRAWRAATRTTQAELANKLGCDHATVSRIESEEPERRLFPNRMMANAIERLTADHPLGPIRAAEWDELEIAARAAAGE